MNPFAKFKNKRVLVTRPRHQVKETIRKLKEAGAKVIHIPLIEIADSSDGFRSLDRAIAKLGTYDWLIFTSQNAVTRFFKRLPSPLGERVRVRGRYAAVGPTTATALRKYGIKKIITPRKDNYSADGLVDALKRYNFKDKRVLFPCAKKAKDTLPLWLKKQGSKLDKVEAYQTIMPRNVDRTRLRKLINENRIDEILFYSQSAMENFLEIVGRKPGVVPHFLNKPL